MVKAGQDFNAIDRSPEEVCADIATLIDDLTEGLKRDGKSNEEIVQHIEAALLAFRSTNEETKMWIDQACENVLARDKENDVVVKVLDGGVVLTNAAYSVEDYIGSVMCLGCVIAEVLEISPEEVFEQLKQICLETEQEMKTKQLNGYHSEPS